MNSEDASSAAVAAKEGMVNDLDEVTSCDHLGETRLPGIEEKMHLSDRKNEQRSGQ